jgi:hypothetical protein
LPNTTARKPPDPTVAGNDESPALCRAFFLFAPQGEKAAHDPSKKGIPYQQLAAIS